MEERLAGATLRPAAGLLAVRRIRTARHLARALHNRIDASENSWMPEDILAQIALARAAGAGGHVHFSISALAQRPARIAGKLREAYR
jgi:hypothetical protein